MITNQVQCSDIVFSLTVEDTSITTAFVSRW